MKVVSNLYQIMVVAQFIIFCSFLYFLGRGLIISIDKISHNKFKIFDTKISGLNLNIFFILIALIFLGNISFIVNFFSGTNNIYFFGLILIICLLNILKFTSPQFSLSGIVNFVLTPGILAVSTISTGLHYDAMLYHIHYQNWIRSEKIVLGLANFHPRFGFSSIYDYISSFLWLDNNFIILHYLNLSFLVVFFSFLFSNIMSTKNNLFFPSIFILLFGILDNFGFYGGRNGFLYIEGVGKPDLGFAVVFLISNLLIISSIIQNRYSNQEFFFFSILILFSIQLRINGLLSLMLLFLYYFKLKNKNFKLILPSALLGFIWILKNLLLTGCLLYPVEITCLNNLTWYSSGDALLWKIDTASFHNGLITNSGIMPWFNSWTDNQLNIGVAKNFIISLIIIFSLKIIFLKSKNKVPFTTKTIVFYYFIINYFFWIYHAPAIRLGMGIFLLNIGVIGLSNLDFKFNVKFNKLIESKYVLISIFMLCVILMPRVHKYFEFLEEPLHVSKIEILNSATMPNPKGGYGVVPTYEISKEETCGLNLKCVPYATEVKLYKSNYFNYKIFK